MIKPNFFIVGAPKCGTTSMDFYLSQHPEIFMAPLKEMHYFAPDMIPPGEQWQETDYLGQFAKAGDARVVGESSVFYMYSEDAARNINDFDPESKILIMLRDPVEVIESHHSQIVYEGYEKEEDINAAVSMEAERKKAMAGTEQYFRERVLYYRELVAFSTQIERFFSVFGSDRIHIIYFDEFRKDVLGEYRKTLDFLGVDPDVVPSLEVQNANKVIRSARLRDFLRNTPEWVTSASRILLPSQDLRYRIKERIKEMNTRYVGRQGLSPELRRDLRRELAPEVERLGRLLNRDLSVWRAN